MSEEDKSTWVVPKFGVCFLEPNEEEPKPSDEGKERHDSEET